MTLSNELRAATEKAIQDARTLGVDHGTAAERYGADPEDVARGLGRHKRSLDERVRGVFNELSILRQVRPRAAARLGVDILLTRRFISSSIPSTKNFRTVDLRDGTRLTYRRNHGDVQTIREMWTTQTYRPPANLTKTETLVDLGANIGLAALYLAKQAGVKRVVAVEPDAENARLLRINLEQNKIDFAVYEAAVAPQDGFVTFEPGDDPNGGMVGDGGVRVPAVSVPSILRDLEDSVLLKMDIEGGEAALFETAVPWLDQVGAVVGELHPHIVDVDHVLAALGANGLHRTGPSWWVRPAEPAPPQSINGP